MQPFACHNSYFQRKAVASTWLIMSLAALVLSVACSNVFATGNDPKKVLAENNIFRFVSPEAVNIKGKVTNSRNEPLADVSVLLKGTSTGTTTDRSGQFTLVTPDGNGALVFSLIGYASQEVPLNGRANLNITLSEEATDMQQVVVTALGIRREAKSLGYSTTTVAPEQVTVNRTTNFMNALEGKIAGVNITSLGSGPAGTSKIVYADNHLSTQTIHRL
jgi:hypothetical protein